MSAFPELSHFFVFSDYNSVRILVSIMRVARPSHYAHVHIHKQNLLCIFYLYTRNMYQPRPADNYPV
jgi:hypothetical protein